MSKWRIMITAVVIAGLIGFFSTGEPPSEAGKPVAQLVSGPPLKPVSNEEVELYLEVYKSMQNDRDLEIDQAVAPHGLSLQEFRDIERRVQMRSSLVDRVRRELVEHAEENSVYAPTRLNPEPQPQP